MNKIKINVPLLSEGVESGVMKGGGKQRDTNSGARETTRKTHNSGNKVRLFMYPPLSPPCGDRRPRMALSVLALPPHKLINLLNCETLYQLSAVLDIALGGGRRVGRTVFLTIVLINKQEIHQGLIKGRYTTEEGAGGEIEGEREGVCFGCYR